VPPVTFAELTDTRGERGGGREAGGGVIKGAVEQFNALDEDELLIRLIVLRMESTWSWLALSSSWESPAVLADVPTRPCRLTRRLLTSEQGAFRGADHVVGALRVGNGRGGGGLFGFEGFAGDQTGGVIFAGIDAVARGEPLQRSPAGTSVGVEIVYCDQRRTLVLIRDIG